MKKTYGELIRAAREAKGKEWTQAVVARRMGVSMGTVSRWENNVTRPNLDQMQSLASLLGIPMDALVESGGVNLRPDPGNRLFAPLVDLLMAMNPREQRRLYEFLAETRRGMDQQ